MRDKVLQGWKDLRGKKGYRVGWACFLSFLFLLSFQYYAYHKRTPQLNLIGRGIWSIPLFLVCTRLLLWFGDVKNRRLRGFAIFLGSLMSCFTVFGSYLHYMNTLFDEPMQIFGLLMATVGFSFCVTPLCGLGIHGMDLLMEKCQGNPDLRPVDRWTFWKYYLAIFLCHLPLFLHWWPGNFVYDACYQMWEVTHDMYKRHHPILHTLLMGVPYKIGDKLGLSVSFGYSLYTLLQVLVLTASFAYTLYLFRKHKAPRAMTIVTFVFFALHPMNQVLGISATKDILFSAFFLFYFLICIRIFVWKEELSWRNLIPLFLTGMLAVMLRKNGIYAIAVAVPFLALLRQKKKEKVIVGAVLLASVLCGHLADEGLMDLMHATNDSSFQESMSVPFNQIARVMAYRGDDIPQEYKDEVLLYWSEDVFSGYNPYLSDPIKDTVDTALVEPNKLNFFKLWGKIGLKFPGEYLEAFLSLTMGYWYPGDTEHRFGIGDEVALYHRLIGTEKEIEKKDFFPLLNFYYDPLFYDLKYEFVPLLAYSFRCALYCLITIFYFVYLWYRKDGLKWMVGMPLYLYFGTVLLGPRTALRYVYCLVVCAPILFYLMLCQKGEDMDAEGRKEF